MSATEVAEIARLLGTDVNEVMLHLGVNGHQGVKGGSADVTKPPREVVTNPPAGAEFETQFMQEWIALGLKLLRNRGI